MSINVKPIHYDAYVEVIGLIREAKDTERLYPLGYQSFVYMILILLSPEQRELFYQFLKTDVKKKTELYLTVKTFLETISTRREEQLIDLFNGFFINKRHKVTTLESERLRIERIIRQNHFVRPILKPTTTDEELSL